MDIFLISPVRNAEPEMQKKVAEYVRSLEEGGHRVHWPVRDTKQDDPTGGYEICKANFSAIISADEIHIWYDEASAGSKFDMGGVFMLVEMLGRKKRVVIANEEEISESPGKSFYKVVRRLVERHR